MARKSKRTAPAAPSIPSLIDAADTAMGAMQGTLLNPDVPNRLRVELDGAVTVLWRAIQGHRAWSHMMLAIPKGMTASIEPIPATCADCGGRALIVPTPPPDTTGLALCQRCSFADPYAPD